MFEALPIFPHVKWFANFTYSDQPVTFEQILSPAFIGLAIFTAIALGIAVLIDRQLDGTGWYERISTWFADQKHRSTDIIRIGTGITLMLSWQADSLLTPELLVEQGWIGWLQFVIAFLLLFPRTVPIAGIGLFFLYFIGVLQFGAFHMLDYVLFLGIGYYLLVSQSSNERTRETGIPALYVTLGFSLFWLGLEKIAYPQWGLFLLEQNPALTLGLPDDFFLTAAAFIELALGFLLVIGLLERPLALVVTLVFFTTTLVFGKTEVIGHTIVHAVLIVFLLEGPGNFLKPPVDIHTNLGLRVAFASVNFLIVLAIGVGWYVLGASAVHDSTEPVDDTEETSHYIEPSSLLTDFEDLLLFPASNF